MRSAQAVSAVVVAIAALAAIAAEPVALERAQAGADHALQGEYAADGAPWAAQVAALGDGAFLLALYAGGLPGAGWDGATAHRVEGRRDGDGIAFPAVAGLTATIADGALAVAGASSATLPRVERVSPTLGAAPPAGALVLFDGSSVDEFSPGAIDERGFLRAGAVTRRRFRDFALHAEFRLPFKPAGRGQDRGNSGVYLQERYEIQILDSFAQPPAIDSLGAIYRQRAAALNAGLPPLAWQTWDIAFTAARFDAAGARVSPARITARLNGIVVHDDVAITAKTGQGAAEGAEPGPIRLQDHGNPVVFRNIWLLESP